MFDNLDIQSWIYIIIGASLLVIVLIFLLYKLIFARQKAKKWVRELDRKFEYLHALLIGQDAQYVKRLEIISMTNLLYVDIHMKFLKRFKEVRDKYDSQAQLTINNMRDLLDSGKYKALKAQYLEAKNIINAYDKEVNALNTDIIVVVKPEEDCRQAALALKDRLRNVKQNYYSRQADLQLISSSFEAVFSHLDERFEDFENLVESAQYDEANTILPEIEKVINELTKVLVQLPDLCVMLSTLLPDKIVSLLNAYEEMEHANYPLHHLMINTSIKDMNKRVEIMTKKVKNFEIRGIKDDCEVIKAHIDEFFRLFEEEKKARGVFENECDSSYQTVNLVEKRYIRLCANIPEVNKVYVLSKDSEAKMNEIKTIINQVGATKRSLDTFIHSGTKQPYSILVDKMKQLQNESNSVITMMNDHQKYLDSLKSICEDAYQLIYAYFERIIRAEKIIRDISIASFNQKYADKITQIYTYLDTINKKLNILPIDVETVNSLAKELRSTGDEMLNEIEQDAKMMQVAEAAIVIGNRDRTHFNDQNKLIIQCEALFYDCKFEDAYIEAGKAIRKARGGE